MGRGGARRRSQSRAKGGDGRGSGDRGGSNKQVSFEDAWTRCTSCKKCDWDTRWAAANWRCACGAQVTAFRSGRARSRGASRLQDQAGAGDGAVVP